MVRQVRLCLVLALLPLAGCGRPSASGPGYDPWAAHWEGAPDRSVDMTATSVAWPTGDRATADLTVEKFFPAEPLPGRPFEGRLVVTNLTDGTLADLVLTERLQPGVSLTASAPQGRSSSTGIYVWTLGTVGPGQTRTIRVLGRVEAVGPVVTSTSASYRKVPAGQDG